MKIKTSIFQNNNIKIHEPTEDLFKRNATKAGKQINKKHKNVEYWIFILWYQKNKQLPDSWPLKKVTLIRARKNNIYKATKLKDYKHKYVIKEVPKSPFYHSDRNLDVSTRMIANPMSNLNGRIKSDWVIYRVFGLLILLLMVDNWQIN